MVFGNRDEQSATGVLFTRNPATGAREAYGDVVFGGQGEDVVAGTQATEPIAVLQDRLPEVARSLREVGDRLERHYRDMCDIEFTIESGRLWLLQVRVGKRSPQAALRIAVDMAEDPAFPLTREEAVRRVLPLLAQPPRIAVPREPGLLALTMGLAASPGVATGELVTDAAAAAEAGAAGRAVILVRAETSPDDVHGMAKAAGILTATGGIASHAAVVARGWGIPAVVGAREISVAADGITVDGTKVATGEVLSIDGNTGEVFHGAVEAVTEPVPEARTLLGWARALGLEIATEPATSGGERPTETDPTSTPDGPAPAIDPDACLRVIGVKGFSTPEALGDALGSSAEAARAAADGLVADGLANAVSGAFRLTDSGADRHRALLDAERGALGADRIDGWFEAFVELDRRVKAIITAWQVREDAPGPEPVLNDHADATYDRAVLERLAAIARDADAWLDQLAPVAPRFARYRRRLDDAAANAAAGDQRFVASPRVDSYHGVWFELHEDLILLAGRSRADEVAAGRA
jgi:pyruvate,orthophosphate dikinase